LFRYSVVLICLLAVNTSSAADFGFGASFKSNESTIYVPVHIGKHFMVEPFFRYEDRDSQNFGAEISSKDSIIGVGLFAVLKPLEKASVYLGARAAYVDQEQSITTPIFGVIQPNPGSSLQRKTKQDGYSIAPTLGFEYWIIEHLTIGAEVAWEYVDLDGSYTSNFAPSSSTSVDSKSNGTRTNIILRFYF